MAAHFGFELPGLAQECSTGTLFKPIARVINFSDVTL